MDPAAMWAAVRDGLAESAGRSEIRPIVDAQRDLGPSDGEAAIQRTHWPAVPRCSASISNRPSTGSALTRRSSSTNGLQRSWITSPTGLAFTIGGLAALVAWIGGNLLIPRTIMQLQAIGGEMKNAGGPPSAELMARMHVTQERLRTIGLADSCSWGPRS